MIKVKEIMEKHNIKSVLVTNENNQLKGIITNRDLIYIRNAELDATGWHGSEWSVSVKKVMTPIENLIYIEEKELIKMNHLHEKQNKLKKEKWAEYEDTDPIHKIVTFLSKQKIQKLPVVNNKDEDKVVGLITLKDILQKMQFKFQR